MDATNQCRPPSAGAAATTDLATIVRQVRRLRREVRDLATIMDAMRDAWCLPTVAEIRDQRRALAAAQAQQSPQEQPPPPVVQAPAVRAVAEPDPVGTVLSAAHAEGLAAGQRGADSEECPYGRRDRGLRRAWMAGLRAASVE